LCFFPWKPSWKQRLRARAWFVDFLIFLIFVFLQRVFLGEGFSFFLSFCVGGFSVKKENGICN
jgi:hypothetical protein